MEFRYYVCPPKIIGTYGFGLGYCLNYISHSDSFLSAQYFLSGGQIFYQTCMGIVQGPIKELVMFI